MEQKVYKQEAPKIDLAVGGQALIEGVMMKSPSYAAMAVRKKDGSIKTKEKPFKSLTAKISLLKLPLVRGIVNLFEMLALGMHAINFSAQEYADDMEEEPAKKTAPNKYVDAAMFAFSFVLSLALAVFLFKFIPLAITEYLRKTFPFIAAHYVVFNFIDGLIRILIFLIYVFTLTLFKTFRRIFEYHGAEHMAVHTYEKGLPLTVEEARRQPRLHPRCGTSFLLAVFIISIVVYSGIPRNPVFWLNLAQRICIIPLIAAIGYELLKWSAKRSKNPLVRIIILPGLLTQKITTKKPDDKQLEVALHALKRAVEMEHAGAAAYAPSPASALLTSK